MAIPRRRLYDLILLIVLLLGGAIVARGWVSHHRLARRDPSASQPERTAAGGPAVDLLRLVDPRADAVAGVWTRDGAALVTAMVPWGRLQLPCVPPEEYDLRLAVTRRGLKDAFILGPIVEGRPCLVELDGSGVRASWIDVREGSKGVVGNRITHLGGPLLRPDRRAEIVCSVRKGRFTLSVDGATVLDWRGDREQLSAPSGWETPNPQALFVGSQETAFEVHEIALVPVSGTTKLLR